MFLYVLVAWASINVTRGARRASRVSKLLFAHTLPNAVRCVSCIAAHETLRAGASPLECLVFTPWRTSIRVPMAYVDGGLSLDGLLVVRRIRVVGLSHELLWRPFGNLRIDPTKCVKSHRGFDTPYVRPDFVSLQP